MLMSLGVWRFEPHEEVVLVHAISSIRSLDSRT